MYISILWCLVGWYKNKADNVAAPSTSSPQNGYSFFPRGPVWTDSFLKALHSTCHLFFLHYLAIRNNLECLPYTKQTPYITASRHVTFVHFVLFLRVLPCCPQKGWARAKLRMITQQIVPRDTLPSHHISAQSCRKAVSIDGSCLRNRKAVFCTLESEIQVLSFGTEI